jgi:hypothetical protein
VIECSAFRICGSFLTILIQNFIFFFLFGGPGLLNPYGVWSPPHSLSDASSSEMEFGTARQYDTSDIFFQEGWLYDDHIFHTKLDDDGRDKEEDKFVLGAHGGSGRTETFDLAAGGDRRHRRLGLGGQCRRLGQG